VPIWINISRRSAYFSPLLFRSGFRACCVVVVVPLQPQFRHFAANWSSFSYVYCENSTGFDVFNITVRFVSCLLCCCRVTLQPQFRQFFSDLLLIFVVFRENSTGFEFKNLRSLCVVSTVLLLSFTPATVTFVSRNLSSFALCCPLLCCCWVSFFAQK